MERNFLRHQIEQSSTFSAESQRCARLVGEARDEAEAALRNQISAFLTEECAVPVDVVECAGVACEVYSLAQTIYCEFARYIGKKECI